MAKIRIKNILYSWTEPILNWLELNNLCYNELNVQRSLYPQYHDEVPLSKAPNPQLLPGHRSINGCPLLRVCVHGVCVFTAVCVHCSGCMFTVCVCVCVFTAVCVCTLGGLNAEHEFRVWVTILGCMSLHSLTFTLARPFTCRSFKDKCPMSGAKTWFNM